MSIEEKRLMKELDIGVEQRAVCCFYDKGYRHEQPSDAVEYAQTDSARSSQAKNAALQARANIEHRP